MSDDVKLKLADGSRVQIARQGAHVLGWQTAGGVEQFYLSPLSSHLTARDGHSPIRGGVPICFPQFNQRVLGGQATPKHGFVRNLPWQLESKENLVRQAQATFTLGDSEKTRAHWPYAFQAGFQVRLGPGQLSIKFAVTNTDTRPWPFALALHSYLAIDDLAHARLGGLQQASFWDGVKNLHDQTLISSPAEADLHITGHIDRVYASPGASMNLHRGGKRAALHISQSKSLTDVVVWNPGADLCAQLSDMPPADYQRMLCVEAGRINAPVMLEPGAQWSGWQAFKLSQNTA